MSTPQQKLLILPRKTVAHLGAAKVGLDGLAGISIAGSGLSALSTLLAGTKASLIVTIIAGLFGGLSLLARLLISYYMNVSVINDPINTDNVQIISQPEPLEPKSS